MHERLKEGRKGMLIHYKKHIYQGIQWGDHRVWYSTPVTAEKARGPYIGSRPSTLLFALKCYFTTPTAGLLGVRLSCNSDRCASGSC
eukprot:scaffold145941_cov34-Prasinocladus_malaysianus.AAC.1